MVSAEFLDVFLLERYSYANVQGFCCEAVQWHPMSHAVGRCADGAFLPTKQFLLCQPLPWCRDGQWGQLILSGGIDSGGDMGWQISIHCWVLERRDAVFILFHRLIMYVYMYIYTYIRIYIYIIIFIYALEKLVYQDSTYLLHISSGKACQ